VTTDEEKPSADERSAGGSFVSSSDVASRFALEKEWQSRNGGELSSETRICRLVAVFIASTRGLEVGQIDAAEVAEAIDELRSTSLFQRSGWALRVRIGTDEVAHLELERSA
jgi:hypothetical protein